VTAQYQSVGAKRVERTLTIMGNLGWNGGRADFVMYPNAVGWLNCNGGPSLVTVNNQVWPDVDREQNKLPIVVERIINWRVTTPVQAKGKVTGAYFVRGAGIRVIQLESDRTAVPFTLQIVYKAKAVEGHAQPEKQAEPVVGK